METSTCTGCKDLFRFRARCVLRARRAACVPDEKAEAARGPTEEAEAARVAAEEAEVARVAEAARVAAKEAETFCFCEGGTGSGGEG